MDNPKIVIAPYAAKLRDASKLNPKNYPVRWWEQVVAKLDAAGFDIVQIGVSGEARIEGVHQFVTNWPMAKLKDLINECATWISVDSFLPHLCFADKLKSGVVIWSISDPNIWGHPENVNILKDRKYLRELQYADWNQAEYSEAAFVLPQVVVDAVLNHVSAKSTEPTNGRRFVPRSVQVAEPATV